MRFFRCINKECPANTPRNGRENQVLESVTILTPLNEEGKPVEDEKASRIADYSFECGLCGDEVEEYTVDKAVICRITRVTPNHLFGEFKNHLRGDFIFNFALDLNKGDVFVKEDITLETLEKEAIKDFCKEEYYEKGIDVEILDVDTAAKNVELSVYNKADRVKLFVYVENGRITDQSGPRDLNPLEEKKVTETIKQRL